MLESTQTVVPMTKAVSTMKSVAQNPSRGRSFELRGGTKHHILDRALHSLPETLRGLVHNVWYTKRGDAASVKLRPPFYAFCVGLLLCLHPNLVFAASGRVTIESGGVSRSAILVEHARLKKSRRPVIIILHSGGGNAVRTRHILGLEDKARSAKPVMIYPEAISKNWSDASKPGDSRDTVFIHDLIGKLVSEGIADRHRIFIVGSSSGGLLALKLACSGEDFAGVVAIFASLPTDIAASCKPAHPMPFLLILGTADPFVPYEGGAANLPDSKAQLLSGNATLDVFAKVAGCAEAHTTISFADHDTRDNSRAYLDKFNGCKVPVELLRVEGGGHLLPRVGGALPPGARVPDAERRGPLGMRNRDVDAPQLIWDFLRHLGA